MLEMVIDSIRVSLMNYQRVVILKERGAERYLPIWIGSPEADAIAVKLQDVSVPRPLTHDLLGSVVNELGAKVIQVVISDLLNDTFFAKLVLGVPDGGRYEIDCRPSDAIAIAVRGGQVIRGSSNEEHWFESVQQAEKFIAENGLNAGDGQNEIQSRVPIFVEDAVLERAGVTIDGDSSVQLGEIREQSGADIRKPVTEEEIKSMSAFSDFLEDLQGLEEFGANPGSDS